MHSKTPTATPADLARLRRRKETDLYQPIITAFAAYGIHLERRNAGRIVIPASGGRKARAVQLGQAGASDLIGWTTRVFSVSKDGCVRPWSLSSIPADQSGGTLRLQGTVVAVEIKPIGWTPRNRAEQVRHVRQLAYLDRVRKDGGLAWVIASVDQVKQVMEGRT